MVRFFSSEWRTAFLQHRGSQLLKWHIASSSNNKKPRHCWCIWQAKLPLRTTDAACFSYHNVLNLMSMFFNFYDITTRARREKWKLTCQVALRTLRFDIASNCLTSAYIQNKKNYYILKLQKEWLLLQNIVIPTLHICCKCKKINHLSKDAMLLSAAIF